jgi:hypothetical protein
MDMGGDRVDNDSYFRKGALAARAQRMQLSVPRQQERVEFVIWW